MDFQANSVQLFITLMKLFEEYYKITEHINV